MHQLSEQKNKTPHEPIDMKPRARRRESIPGSADPRIHKVKKAGLPRRSIRLDTVHPRDMVNVDVRFFCDDCSHYSFTAKHCTIGFVAQHTRENQMKIYNLTGKIAFCRFIEID